MPALFAFGPSVLLVRLNAVAWSLFFPLGLYVLARRIFDESAARVTLLLAAVPPFLLTYYSTVAEPHFEANTFGVVLLLLALVALTARTEPRRARSLACLGFVAGLACWTNMKVLVVLGPILLLLLVQDPRLPCAEVDCCSALGLLVGNLPAWLFYVTQPDPGQGNIGSARRFLVTGVDLSWPRVSEFLVHALPSPSAPTTGGPSHPSASLALALCGGLYLGAVSLRSSRRSGRSAAGPGAPRVGALAPPADARRHLPALYFSGFNLVADVAGRYLLPAYIPLFLFLGAAVARLARRSRLPAGVVLDVRSRVPRVDQLRLPLAAPAGRASAPASRDRHAGGAQAPSAGSPRRGAALWTTRESSTGSSSWAVRSFPRSHGFLLPVVSPGDAAGRVAILATQHDDGWPSSSTRSASDRTATRWGTGGSTRTFSVPDRAYRLVPRAGWRAVGEADTPPASADGDLGTIWPTRRLDGSEAGALVLDLGASRAVARVVLWPTALADVIVPLEVAGSLDGDHLGRLGGAPERVGRAGVRRGSAAGVRPRNGWLELVDRAASRPVPARQPGAAGPGRRRHGGGAVRLRGARWAREARRWTWRGSSPSCAPAA